MNLVDSEQLQRTLDALLHTADHRGMVLGVSQKERIATAALSEAGDLLTDMRVAVGCIAKLFTFSLLRRAIHERRIGLDDGLCRLLPRSALHGVQPGITLRHLLDHSHGLDDSAVITAPYRKGGWIDVDALFAALTAAPAIMAPGRFYSYGSGAALIGAAILEASYAHRYADILQSCLVVAGASNTANTSLPICPATGGSLALSVTDLLTSLDACVGQYGGSFRDVTTDDFTRNLTMLPGWHSIEQGIYLGWKYYGGGWFGHNSEMPGAESIVRLNPQLRVGIAVSSSRHPPSTVAGALVREYWPTLASLRMPAMRPDRQIDANEFFRYCGDYANNTVRYSVRARADGKLEALMRRRADGAEVVHTASLYPAQEEIFFLQPPAPSFAQFLEFVGDTLAGFSHVWTGSTVLRRVPRPA